MVHVRSLLVGAVGSLMLVAALRAGPSVAQGASAAPARRCVGLFIDEKMRGRMVQASATGMRLQGDSPCMRQAGAFTLMGVCRAWDDGAVEVLAQPLGTCPGEAEWGWLSYPP